MTDLFLARYVYLLIVLVLAVGLYGMLAKRNLAKKLIGLTIFQGGIFVFFIQGATKLGARPPVIDPVLGADPGAYVNPLPHLLILTAIVVGASVTGVGLAFLIAIQREWGTLDEEDLLARMSEDG